MSPRRKLAEQWGVPVLPDGFVALPGVLLDHAGSIGLSPTDVALVQQILRYERGGAATAFPSTATLAKKLGISRSAVKTHWPSSLAAA